LEEVSCTSDHVDSLFLYCGFVVFLTAVALSQERSSRYGALSVRILCRAQKIQRSRELIQVHSIRNDIKEYVTGFVAGKGAARLFSYWLWLAAAKIPNRQGEGLLIRALRASNCAADIFQHMLDGDYSSSPLGSGLLHRKVSSSVVVCSHE
jgi:hypothetical protein